MPLRGSPTYGAGKKKNAEATNWFPDVRELCGLVHASLRVETLSPWGTHTPTNDALSWLSVRLYTSTLQTTTRLTNKHLHL